MARKKKTLNDLIEGRGVKKSWLANHLGIRPANVTNWCRGIPVPEKHKKRLANLLSVEVGDIT